MNDDKLALESILKDKINDINGLLSTDEYILSISNDMYAVYKHNDNNIIDYMPAYELYQYLKVFHGTMFYSIKGCTAY